MNSNVNNLLDFLKSKVFFKHLGLAFIVLVILLMLMMKWISSFTDHNEFIVVPKFIGVKTKEVDKSFKDLKLRVMIIDSIYESNMPKGVVVEQTPLAGTNVKENRTIYLTVNAVLPQQIRMPRLVDVSLRQATSMLESYGFKLGAIAYVPDFAQNAVIQQRYHGQQIEAGTLLPKGATINLVLGKGLSDEEVIVPNVIGMTRKQALEELNLSQLSIGAEVFDEQLTDSSGVLVYKQVPVATDSKVKAGTSVDLFYTNDKAKLPSETPAEEEEENK